MQVSHPSTTISFFLTYFGGGGAERVLINLANGFVKSGYQVDFVLGQAWGPHLKKIPSEITVVDLKAAGSFASIRKLAQYLKHKEPQALISGMHFANEVAILAKRLVKTNTVVIATEHNTLTHSLRHNKNRKKRIIPFAIRLLYPWADRVVTVSQGATASLTEISSISPDKITTIYNPVIAPDLFSKANADIDHPWFQPGEPPVIIGVGKLEPQKDFPTLIRAFARVRKQLSCRLVILGWGPDLEKLKEFTAEMGVQDDVDLMGYVDNPYPYMARAQVFTLSSAWEGLPTVLIEALALGKPVVSTDCPSGPREILQGGKYGALTPVGDDVALAAAIGDVLGQQSQSDVSEWLHQFSIEASTNQYLDLINTLKTAA
ncbi:glycosyl transferase, group 1 [Acaryochloris marina MBIC11017]|uniref:Glycosyl transferase, group 1 n=1 Tax=Acaryochloris marina (strain MBIC 11017) TaxID=329726 RepID=B0C0U0_ACAM1|nr:glycosyl transferase, group 1 [Acaryochloris marina MBIC11017]BDM80907.1 glycosyl transferase [Acaryochloris marina MBIC10699]